MSNHQIDQITASVYAYPNRPPYLYCTATFRDLAPVGSEVDLLCATPGKAPMLSEHTTVGRISRCLPVLTGANIATFIKRWKLKHCAHVRLFVCRVPGKSPQIFVVPKRERRSLAAEQAFAGLVFLDTADRIGPAAHPPCRITPAVRRRYSKVLKPAIPKDGVEGMVDQALAGLIGMTQLREHLLCLTRFGLAAQAHTQATGRVPDHCLHAAFIGPPGTGKTESARRVAALLHRVGLLRRPKTVVVHARELTGAYVGQTAPLVRKTIKRALGGVLFVDEASSLIQGDSEGEYGREAASALLPLLESHRDDLMVIFAGHDYGIMKLLDSHTGLRSRVPTTIEFGHLDANQALEVLVGFAAADGVVVAPEVAARWTSFASFLHVPNTGRDVRVFWQQLKFGPVAARHASTGGQMRLLATDLDALKWHIAIDLHRSGGILDVSGLDGQAN